VVRIVRAPGFVDIHTDGGSERFDAVVMACHSDQALQLLAHPTTVEVELLSAVRYQTNRCVLHTDSALMPRRRKAWSAWNYLQVNDADALRPVALTYWMNLLQPLPFKTQLFETLNPPVEPRTNSIIAEFEYSHPLLNQAAVLAQRRIATLQGENGTYFAGAWLKNGFHEDGLSSALDIVGQIGRASDQMKPRMAAE
jgi:predicted NAD/FAD-binding protein